MSSDDRDVRAAAMLERLARSLEGVGFPRAMARAYAALMMADGEGLSTSELVETLGLSRASISNTTQFLVSTSLIETYHVRGSRETHYRMLKGTWGDLLTRKFGLMKQIPSIAKEAMDVTDSPLAHERLQEMYEVYSFFGQEFEKIMVSWNERMGR
ncbi:MAG: hypothetical protein KJ747_01500 [Actinobacteria bacterium]|nr:hypothetical protein [Actinomycetota bacterium]MCG2807591.1 hypothetical protein [Coriobacteriia bacterium]MDP2232787.1 hypothetical protein [Actinomycetota bacterium]